MLSFISPFVAANETTGLLKQIFINKDGLVLFKLSNSMSPRVKCASNVDWDFKFSLNDKFSEQMLELLKLSKTQSVQVNVGYGAEAKCGKGFPAVDIEYLYLNNMLKATFSDKGNYKTRK